MPPARDPRSGVDRQRQLTDAGTGVEAIALAQQAQAVAHRRFRVGLLPRERTTGQAAQLSGARIAVSLLGKTANIPSTAPASTEAS